MPVMTEFFAFGRVMVLFEMGKEWEKFWDGCWQKQKNFTTLGHVKFMINLRYSHNDDWLTF